MIRNQRTILMLAIGLILTVSVVIAAASAGVRLAPGSTGSSVIGTTMEEGGNPLVKQSGAPGNGSTFPPSKNATNEPNSTNAPPPSATGFFSPSSTSEDNPSSTAMPSPTEDGRDIRTPTATSSPIPASSRPPTGNLLVNPYFEGKHGSTSIPGWVNDGHWDVSVKAHEPSPNTTAARINTPDKAGFTNPGETAIIYQIVQGGGSSLAASIACVQHYADVMQVTVLGSQSSEGPWTHVWQPFDISICGFADWGPTLHAQTQLPHAWAYYQYQIIARFEDDRGGVKVTNASLSIE